MIVTCAPLGTARGSDDLSDWTIFLTNDNCPDYTWGYTEQQTRHAFAKIVRSHLDLMKQTDGESLENRDRYNMAVTQEALCFLEYYPDRESELIHRIKEGRIFVSPYLCNSLWGFQSFEGAIRTFYPARRLEDKWGIKFDVAEHIELPSLPWGTATILSGCGVKWLSLSFLEYDSTFRDLKNPPLFIFEGPDGSTVRVILDRWASTKSNYTQGAYLLKDPANTVREWCSYYSSLGRDYPLKAALASGTHGDISPQSGEQASGFAETIIKYNSHQGKHPRLVNATLPLFCDAIDKVQAETPFMPTLRGCFGHSWELWPVSLAKYVAEMRSGERKFLAAEALTALAASQYPELHTKTCKERETAEWYWSMLSDHAWNGSSEQNRKHNAELRREWAQQLHRLSNSLLEQAWTTLKLRPSRRHVTVFNGLSFSRKELIRLECSEGLNSTATNGRKIASQIFNEEGKSFLYFVSPEISGYGFAQVELSSKTHVEVASGELNATDTQLESPYYRLEVDTETGGIKSIFYKIVNTELITTPGNLCQAVYFDGAEHVLEKVESKVVAKGPVLARLRISGTIAGIDVVNYVTVYAELNRVDFELHIYKPVTTEQQRLCHVFPVLQEDAVLRIETTGAVIRPKLQPDGDLLPGADTRRFVVQDFIDASMPDGPGVTISPIDAFALRLDLKPITFEALGNNQNYREVVRNQHEVKSFLFRYSLQAHSDRYKDSDAYVFSRSVASPLITVFGLLPDTVAGLPTLRLDPRRAIATCFKPAEGDISRGSILRIREISGNSNPVTIGLKGYRKAILTDLLERDKQELNIIDGQIEVNIKPNGFTGLRLLP